MENISADFELLSPLPGLSVKARFAGLYQGRPIQWSLELYTVDYFFMTHARLPQHDAPKTPQQFIYIEEQGAVNFIMIALSVPHIDEPTLKKVLIMIRNYKRLRPGWHAWGASNAKS